MLPWVVGILVLFISGPSNGHPCNDNQCREYDPEGPGSWTCFNQVSGPGLLPSCIPTCDPYGLSNVASCTLSTSYYDNYSGCEYPGELISIKCSRCYTTDDCDNIVPCKCKIECKWTNLWCPVAAAQSNSDIQILLGGDGFIQFGSFRLGIYDENHLSLSSIYNDQIYTEFYVTNDGNYIDAITDSNIGVQYNLFDSNRPLLSSGPTNVKFTTNGIEFGINNEYYFCIGISRTNHLSITHNNKNSDNVHWTSQIFREDGTLHPGPRNDNYDCWAGTYSNYITTSRTDNNYNIIFNNYFKILHFTGDISSDGYEHLSFLAEKTIVIYRSGGTVHPGPRTSWNGGWIGDGTCNSNIKPVFDFPSIFMIIFVAIAILSIANIFTIFYVNIKRLIQKETTNQFKLSENQQRIDLL